jgi:hypothetical protein
MEINRYFEQIVDPTIADFEANPTSVRHAFLAAVAVFHATTDYLGGKPFRDDLRQNADFVTVDRIAHAFKHVRTRDPKIAPLSAGEVIARPPAAWDSGGAWDLSSWDDPIGGVTLDSERAIDVLSAIRAPPSSCASSSIDGPMQRKNLNPNAASAARVCPPIRSS